VKDVAQARLKRATCQLRIRQQNLDHAE